MRFRSVLIYLWPLIFLSLPSASAQKRIFATVNPNAAALNGTADIYDPQTGKITQVAEKMKVARQQHVAVKLTAGKVLIAGGYNNRYLDSAELFNPSTGSFSLITDEDDHMVKPRAGAGAALLQGGTVLLVGGYDGTEYLDSAETFDPADNRFSSTSSGMSMARYHPVVTRLNAGLVLITGGFNGTFLNTADIYDSTSRSFASSNSYMSDTRDGHTATLLQDGKVLIAGGCTNSQTDEIVCSEFLNSADIYDPDNDTFTELSAALITPRANHATVLLHDGRVLILGGRNGSEVLASAEIYDPQTEEFTAIGNMTSPRYMHTATVLANGKVLISGGYSDRYLDSAEIFDPQTGTFTAVSPAMSAPRFQHSSTLLGDGRVLLTGGQNKDFLLFDVNHNSTSDDIPPNIVFSSDSKTGFVSYPGSGTVLAFSAETGAEIKRIVTGGKPMWITPVNNAAALAVVSALDDKIFIINPATLSLQATYTFTGTFGFGSMIEVSPDGKYGYVSSTGTGEVIKFDPATGQQLGRLKGLNAPAQITVTKDGSTLIVVDVSENELVFVDASSMTAKSYKMSPPDEGYTTTSFTISNKAVLNLDESAGLVASADGYLFVFDPANGEIEDVLSGGSNPGFTTLTVTGTFWLVLNDGSLSIIPTWDPSTIQNVSAASGSPLAAANIVIPPSVRYAFYTSAGDDKLYQHDFITGAVVGAYAVGDDPDQSPDHAGSVALTPDAKTMAVMNFSSNQLDLLADTTLLRQTKFTSAQEKFTGISVVNLSDAPANITFTAIADFGTEYVAEDIQNPVTIQLPANAQTSIDVSRLFNLDTDATNSGYVTITSDQPAITGFSNTGQVHSDYLNAYLSNVQGIPLHTNIGDQLHDWIIPEIPQEDGTTAELSFVNPNYNTSMYEVVHYSEDGTKLETRSNFSVNGSYRQSKKISEFVTGSQSGQVLIVGGYDMAKPIDTLNTAEVYNVSSRTFATTSSAPGTGRQGHTASVLRNGKVLIAGGKSGQVIVNTASLYDPTGSKFTETYGTMNADRFRHTSTLLPDGKVLIAGGQSSQSINRTAELYDPEEEEEGHGFSYTAGMMTTPREAHTATLLSDGKVLLIGGLDGVSTSATAEIYDPATSRFTATGSMSTGRAFHTAVLMHDGRVLVVGGYNGEYLNSAEIYDPATGSFSAIEPMTAARSRHTATVLNNGTVLVAGGENESGPLDTAEIYDPAIGQFLPTTGTMLSPRSWHTASLIEVENTSDDADNDEDDVIYKVLLVGGTDGDETLDTAEVYDPVTREFTQTAGDMNGLRQGHTATLLTGSTSEGYLRATSKIGMLFTEIYDEGGADASINGINVDKYEGVKTIYSPQFAILPDYITKVNIINANDDNDATVTLTLHAPDGTVLGAPKSWVLPRNAQIKGDLLALFLNDSRLVNQTGWLEVTSSVDKIVGTVSFTNAQKKFLASFELSAAPMRRFVFPLVSEDSEYETGIALLNSNDTPANVQLELWGPSGTLDASATVVLNAHSRLSKPLGQLFPGLRGHRFANVRVRSDQPLHGLGVLYSLDLHFISSVLAVPYPGE